MRLPCPASRHQARYAAAHVERILFELSDFTNGEPQRDDMTLVVMKVQKE